MFECDALKLRIYEQHPITHVQGAQKSDTSFRSMRFPRSACAVLLDLPSPDEPYLFLLCRMHTFHDAVDSSQDLAHFFHAIHCKTSVIFHSLQSLRWPSHHVFVGR